MKAETSKRFLKKRTANLELATQFNQCLAGFSNVKKQYAGAAIAQW